MLPAHSLFLLSQRLYPGGTRVQEIHLMMGEDHGLIWPDFWKLRPTILSPFEVPHKMAIWRLLALCSLFCGRWKDRCHVNHYSLQTFCIHCSLKGQICIGGKVTHAPSVEWKVWTAPRTAWNEPASLPTWWNTAEGECLNGKLTAWSGVCPWGICHLVTRGMGPHGGPQMQLLTRIDFAYLMAMPAGSRKKGMQHWVESIRRLQSMVNRALATFWFVLSGLWHTLEPRILKTKSEVANFAHIQSEFSDLPESGNSISFVVNIFYLLLLHVCVSR